MNSRLTLWLTALALGLFGYIYFFDRGSASELSQAAAPAKLLPEFDPARATSIEITRSNETVRAELSAGQWRLVSPSYPAQATAVETFLDTLGNLTKRREVSAQEIIAESGGLSPFGLDPPAAVIKVQSSGKTAQFRVGAKTLLGDNVYVQPLGASGVFTTDVALLRQLPASASAWRDPMLVSQENLVFDRIDIVAGSRPLKLERDRTTHLWRLVEPMPTRADFARVEYLVQQLRNARVTRFVTDNPKADLEPYGLQAPEASLTLAFGSNTVFQVQFGKNSPEDPSQVYARCLSQSNVVLVSRELADLVEKNYMDYRDRSLLSFRPNLVDRIEAKADETFVVQRQGEDWRILVPFQAKADRQQMQLFLDKLAKVEIVRFEKDVVADFSPYGLANPTSEYILKTSVTNSTGLTNQTLVQVDFGSVPTNEMSTVYCRRSDESSVYVVPFADMFNLDRAAYALRDRRVWNFAASNVTAVAIQQQGRRHQLTRDPVTRTWDRENPVRHAAIEETLHRLGQLQADSWVAKGTNAAERFGTTAQLFDLSLQLNQGGKTNRLNLSFGKPARTGQPYASVVLEQGEPVVFRFPISVYAMVAEYLTVPKLANEP